MSACICVILPSDFISFNESTEENDILYIDVAADDDWLLKLNRHQVAYLVLTAISSEMEERGMGYLRHDQQIIPDLRVRYPICGPFFFAGVWASTVYVQHEVSGVIRRYLPFHLNEYLGWAADDLPSKSDVALGDI